MAFKLIKTDTKDSNSKILQQLNSEQIKAVMKTEGPLLIVAGAGSGKTRVLTHKIAYLVEKGVSPHNILALTFTNKAAEEMKNRIAAILNYEIASKIWAGTFHSIFARILRVEAEHLGYTSSFTIYDEEDSTRIIKNIMNKLGLSIQAYQPSVIKSKISWAKNQVINWIQYRNNAETLIDKQAGLVFEHYENELKNNNAMDFDDLLINMNKLLELSNEILEKYQNRFKYILVDEYQDTNRAQYLVIKKLAGKSGNIAVVGDDAQSIYKWRGADIRNILEFERDFKDAEIIRLEQNYRSTGNILKAADSVIKFNKNQIEKNLWTERDPGDLIEVMEYDDDRIEAYKIIEIIKNYVESKKYKLGDFAVLYRTNAQSLALENACLRSNLPYIVIGSTSFYKRKEIKDVLAYLRFLINPSDSESLTRMVNEPPRGIGPATINHLREFADQRKINLFEAFKLVDECELVHERYKILVKKFVDFLNRYLSSYRELTSKIKTNENDFIDSQDLSETKEFNDKKDMIKDIDSGLKIIELIKNYIDETTILQMYKEINTEEALDRWNNVQQLLSDIFNYFQNNPNHFLEEYLQQITLSSDIDNKDTSKDQIKLMTLHSAKGLEFPVVFIIGLEQGLFPISKSEFHPDEEEEERRLFYVGITRAMEKLYLSYAKKRLRFGDIVEQNPSKFLTEIDHRYISWDHSNINLKEQRLPSFTRKETTYNTKTVSKKEDPVFDDLATRDNEYSQITPKKLIKVGTIVNHSHFGIGRIESITGSDTNRQAMVNFQSVGRKKLMLQYAKLEIVK
ncbi:MAG: UvrD-helicase domain-containing protein [Candidatus Kapabacteria bacterium]|nr:UvrD-helicase domain-containing protein [Candidatus Kapabacteria bacterium]